jgi:hypothetical protein
MTESVYTLPEELKGLNEDQLDQSVRRLKMDMEAELSIIRSRYQDKIEYFEEALSYVQTKGKIKATPTQ